MKEQDIITILANGGIVGMRTDTIYGILARADLPHVVERVYVLRKRNPEKPCIILIGDISQIDIFSISLSSSVKEKLSSLWPGPVSIIFNCPSEKFSYLHRGTYSLAFRLPNDEKLIRILKATGPLIAPSLNWEGHPPAETIEEAKKYFGDEIEYVDEGKVVGKPSKVVRYNDETDDFTIIRN